MKSWAEKSYPATIEHRISNVPDYKTAPGNVEIIALSDGNLDFSPHEFFPSVPAESWEPYRDQLTPKGTVLMNVGSFLLRSDGKTFQGVIRHGTPGLKRELPVETNPIDAQQVIRDTVSYERE